MAWRGKARHGSARQGSARHGKARQGHYYHTQGLARLGEAGLGEAWQGKARHGMVRHGEVRRGKARLNKMKIQKLIHRLMGISDERTLRERLEDSGFTPLDKQAVVSNYVLFQKNKMTVLYDAETDTIVDYKEVCRKK